MKNDSVFANVLSHIGTLIIGFGIAVGVLNALGLLSSRRSEREFTDRLSEAAEVIDAYYVGEYDTRAMSDNAISAMVYSLGDRWSYYLSEEELEEFILASMNRYDGLGIVLQPNGDGTMTIIEVYDNSPAREAGLTPGCVITAVNGEDIAAMEYEQAIEMMKGAVDAGTVTLRAVMPDGSVKETAVTPRAFDIDPVSYELLDGDIGLIKISNFEDRCAEQLRSAAGELVRGGAGALVFDVRYNPGGQLEELIAALDLILPEGTIFMCRDAFGNEDSASSDADCIDMPMAVLINGSTYSAAEFFAAALDEFGWAYTVGEKTTGKGFAQVTVPLSGGGAIHISSIEYFTPKGVSLADVGLTPYAEEEMSYDDSVSLYYGTLAHEDDVQLQRAVELLSEKMRKAS